MPLSPHGQPITLPLNRVALMRMDNDVQVARHSSAARLVGRLTFAREPNLGAIFDAGRDPDLDTFLALHLSRAMAGRAWGAVYPPFAATGVAHAHVDELAENRLMRAANLAASAAARARFELRARLEPAAATRGAELVLWDLDLFLAAKDRFFERQGEIGPQVNPSLSAGP